MADPSVEFQELFPAPHRRRSPRAAIVLLPFTLAMMLLFWVLRGLWLSFWKAVVTTLHAAWWCWWVGILLLFGWALVWFVGDHATDQGLRVGGFTLLIYWPWFVGNWVFAMLHLVSAAVAWSRVYRYIALLWNTQQLDGTVLLIPITGYLFMLGIIFLVAFCWRLPRMLRPRRR